MFASHNSPSSFLSIVEVLVVVQFSYLLLLLLLARFCNILMFFLINSVTISVEPPLGLFLFLLWNFLVGFLNYFFYCLSSFVYCQVLYVYFFACVFYVLTRTVITDKTHTRTKVFWKKKMKNTKILQFLPMQGKRPIENRCT